MKAGAFVSRCMWDSGKQPSMGADDKAEVGAEDEKKRPTELGGCREARFSYLSPYWELTSLGTTSWVVIQIELTS